MAATCRRIALNTKVEWFEAVARDHGNASMKGSLPFLFEMLEGVGVGQCDLVWSDAGSLAATTVDIDVAGGITSQVDGGTVTMVKVKFFAIKNRGTASLTVGVAGSNPFIAWLAASGDGIVIPAGGFVMFYAPSGYASTAGSADTLRLNSGSATIPYDILFAGSSS